MTNRERYEAGLVMERNGAAGEDIAAALGYKTKQAWWQDKHKRKKEQAKDTAADQIIMEESERMKQGLTARARENKSPAPEPAPILEGLSCVDKVHVPVKPATKLAQSIKADMDRAKARKAEPVQEKPAAAAPKILLIQREFSAQGEKLKYRFFDGKVTIKQIGAHDKAIVLSNNDVIIMMLELHELLMEVKDDA